MVASNLGFSFQTLSHCFTKSGIEKSALNQILGSHLTLCSGETLEARLGSPLTLRSGEGLGARLDSPLYHNLVDIYKFAF